MRNPFASYIFETGVAKDDIWCTKYKYPVPEYGIVILALAPG
jgi:hypothetical protein